MFTTQRTIVTGLAVLALAACGDDGTDPTGPGDDSGADQATVRGSIENTTEPESSAAASAASSQGQSGAAAQASTVAVAAVESSGSLDVLAEADVQADGTFVVEDVPAGRSGLVVSARNGSGDEVGRVLVHGETRSGATVRTEPVTAETTVEGRVRTRMVAEGASEEVRSSGTIALLIRMDEATAADVAASGSAVAEVAAAYRAGAEALVESFAEVEADAEARMEAVLEAAVAHAESRDGGASAEAAHDAFVEAALDAFVEAGADAEDVAVATGVAAIGLDRAMLAADENARLELARNAVRLNLQARERLVAEQPSSDESDAAASALADARVGVEAAVSVDEMATALLEAEQRAEEEITAAILARLPSSASLALEAQIETLVGDAFADADLSARVGAAVEVGAILDAVVDYRQQVRSRVQAVVEALPSEVELDAEVTARLIVAAACGPSLES